MRQTSIRVYPRPDQEFKKKDSLDFMTGKTAIYQKRPHGGLIHFYSWLAFGIMGVVTGVVTFVFELLVQVIVEYRWVATQTVLDNGSSNNLVFGYLVFFSICVFVGFLSVLLTVLLSPAAAGGGGAECMGYFNGVMWPDLYSVETFIVKFFGLTFSVASALCIGKEGVLGHMGSIIGIMVLYAPFFPMFKYFRNTWDKRNIAAAGQAAGVAAAFGAPIGGTLYAYEMTSPAVFWHFELAWQVFFSAVLSDFAESICDAFKSHDPPDVTNAGAIKFGTYDPNPYTIQDLGFFLIMAVFTGFLGAFFVSVNYMMGKLRKKYIGVNKVKKVIEVIVFVGVTCTVSYFAPSWINDPCLLDTGANFPDSQTYLNDGLNVTLRYTCPPNEYNQLASLLFNTQSNQFKTFLTNNVYLNYSSLIIYFLIWYWFAIFTLGISVPMGLFVSGILMGCSFGRIWALFLSQYVLPGLHPGSYALVGATGLLAGYARHTFSLCVIMLECSNQINMFVPLTLVILVSYLTAGIYNRSIYLIGVRLKNIPFLTEEIPHRTEKVTAEMMMSCPVRSLGPISTVEQIKKVMDMPVVHGFPVVDEAKNLIGLITREALMVLIGNKCWIEEDANSKMDIIMNKYSKGIANLERRFSSFKSASELQKHKTTGHLHKNLGMIKEELEDEGEGGDGGMNAQNQEKPLMSGQFKQIKDHQPNYQQQQVYERTSLNADLELELRKGSKLAQTIQCKEDEQLLDQGGNEEKIKLTWEDFNCNYNQYCPNFSDIAEIVKFFPEKRIDLRPYMILRPYRVVETDTLEVVHQLFRHMDIRTLPVLKEEDHTLVGVITRQDLFQYLSI